MSAKTFFELEKYIRDNLDLIDVVEIEPQAHWIRSSNGYRLEDGFALLTNIPRKKLVHSISLPVANTMIDEEQLALLIKVIDTLDAVWVSEHLSFNKVSNSNGHFDTGFFLPPCQTIEGIESCVNMICKMKRKIQRPFAIETGVNYLQYKFEISDGEFVSQVAQRAGCGILLDLHNIWTNELNGRESVKEFLKEIPLERVWEVHLVGGLEEDGYWLDAHAGAIPNELFELSRKVIRRLPNLHAIIFEMYPSYLQETDSSMIRQQLKELHKLWDIKGIESTNVQNEIRSNNAKTNMMPSGLTF